MFKWLFTKEHLEKRKSKAEKGPNGLSFWARLLHAITYSSSTTRVNQRSYGNNSGNYNYTKQSHGKTFSHIITNGKEEFIVNGKKLTPGTTEYAAAKKSVDNAMRTFDSGMQDFEKSMDDFAKGMKGMWK